MATSPSSRPRRVRAALVEMMPSAAVHRHLPGGQPVHQIQVDEGPLARLAHPGGGVGHGEDIAAEQENDGYVTLQGGGQAVLALDGGDHRARGQEIQELVSIHRAAPAFHGDKKGRKTTR